MYSLKKEWIKIFIDQIKALCQLPTHTILYFQFKINDLYGVCVVTKNQKTNRQHIFKITVTLIFTCRNQISLFVRLIFD